MLVDGGNARIGQKTRQTESLAKSEPEIAVKVVGDLGGIFQKGRPYGMIHLCPHFGADGARHAAGLFPVGFHRPVFLTEFGLNGFGADQGLRIPVNIGLEHGGQKAVEGGVVQVGHSSPVRHWRYSSR